jgi:hypothetical protein
MICFPFYSEIVFLKEGETWFIVDPEKLCSHISGFSYSVLKNFLMDIIRMNKILERKTKITYEDEFYEFTKLQALRYPDTVKIIKKILDQILKVDFSKIRNRVKPLLRGKIEFEMK